MVYHIIDGAEGNAPCQVIKIIIVIELKEHRFIRD